MSSGMAMAENYQLKWHSFSTYLHSCVADSLKNESFADVALVTLDGRQIMAHRFVLSAHSQYFRQVLKLYPKLATTLPLLIVLPSEISYKTLKILVQYMYSGEATVSNDILENVIRGGDILKVKGLYRPKEIQGDGKSNQKNVNNTTKPNTEKQQPKPIVPKEQKVLNYTMGITNFDKKSPTVDEQNAKEKLSKPEKQNSPQESNCSEDSKSDDHLQFLVIKEEPIEWSEISHGEMEIIDEKEVFPVEVKSEIITEESEQSTEGLYSPLTCELCTETFTIPAEWVRHVQTHTDMLPAKRQRRDKPFKDDDHASFPALHCDMCQTYFPTPAEWVHHIQDSHTEFELHLSNKKQPAESTEPVKDMKQTRPITNVYKTCSECNKVFPSHASMVIHKRTHTGEKPYTCEICYKGFNVKSNLLRHLRTLHNKIINPTDIEIKDDDDDDSL